MIDKNAVTAIRDKIINSDEFTRSQIHRNLLKFLIQSYLNDEIVKEMILVLGDYIFFPNTIILSKDSAIFGIYR